MAGMTDTWTDEDWAALDAQLRAEGALVGWDTAARRPVPGREACYAPKLEDRCSTAGCGHLPDAHDPSQPFTPCRRCRCPVLLQPDSETMDTPCLCGHALRHHTVDACARGPCVDGFSIAMPILRWSVGSVPSTQREVDRCGWRVW